MAKAIIEFDLNEIDDEEKFQRAAAADAMASCLWEIVHNSWREFKHTDYDYEPYQKAIADIINQHGIDVDKLWK